MFELEKNKNTNEKEVEKMLSLAPAEDVSMEQLKLSAQASLSLRDIMNENKLSKEGYLNMMQRIRNRIANEMAEEDLFRKVVNIMR